MPERSILNVATFPRLTTRKFYKIFSKYRKTTCIDQLLLKLAQGFSCYLSFARVTSEPRNLQNKCIKIKTRKIKPSTLKIRKTEDHNNLKAWVASQVTLWLLSLDRPSCVRLTGAQPQTTIDQQKFRDPTHFLCRFQTCGGIMLIKLATQINLHSLPIHLESTSLRVH